jgi:hypothetical protein
MPGHPSKDKGYNRKVTSEWGGVKVTTVLSRLAPKVFLCFSASFCCIWGYIPVISRRC